MARTGGEATASMGADIPLAVLSDHVIRCSFDYFKQQFAQVTNPPIDAIREQVVTDTHVYVGSDGNLLEEKPENCRVLQIENPILTAVELMKIRAMQREGFCPSPPYPCCTTRIRRSSGRWTGCLSPATGPAAAGPIF